MGDKSKGNKHHHHHRDHRHHGHHHHDSAAESSLAIARVRPVDQYGNIRPVRGASRSGSYSTTSSHYSSHPREDRTTSHSSSSGDHGRLVSRSYTVQHIRAPRDGLGPPDYSPYIPGYREVHYDYTGPYQESVTSYAPSSVSTQRLLPAPSEHAEHAMVLWDPDQAAGDDEDRAPQGEDGKLASLLKGKGKTFQRPAAEWLVRQMRGYSSGEESASVEKWLETLQEYNKVMEALKEEQSQNKGEGEQRLKDLAREGEGLLGHVREQVGKMYAENRSKGGAWCLFDNAATMQWFGDCKSRLDDWHWRAHMAKGKAKLQRHGHWRD